MAGLLGSFFNFVDPILDTIDPIHNPVQEWTTGSSTTKGQSPYFETIAPMVLDLFLPGVGSAVGAADKASTGNYAGAALSALSAYGALGSAGSAATGAGTELAATEGLSSTAGTAAGTTAENAVAAYPVGTMTNSGGEILDAGSTTLTSGAADAGGASSGFTNGIANNATAGQPGYGWQYYENGTAISPTGQYYLGGEQLTGAGGQQMGLMDYAGKYYDKGRVAMNGVDGKQVGKTVGAGLMTGQQQKAKNAQRMPTQLAPADFGGQSSGPAQSFQTLSPYSSFSGGFNPQKRRGLL